MSAPAPSVDLSTLTHEEALAALAAVVAKGTDLQGRFDAQQVRFDALLQHVTARDAAAALQPPVSQSAASASSSSPAASSSPVFATPAMRQPPLPIFSGQYDTLDVWLAQTVRHFKWLHFDTNAQRLHNVAILLNGPADDWWNSFDTPPTTWDDFVAALRRRFDPIDSQEQLRKRLVELRQGKGGDGIFIFVDKFRSIASRITTMAVEDQIFHFKRGLHADISKAVTMADVKSLAEAEEIAVRFGAVTQSSSSSSSSSSSRPSPPSDDNAMDINNIEGLSPPAETDGAAARATPLEQILAAIKASGARSSNDRRFDGRGPRAPPVVRNLTPAQVKERMETGQCFNCGQTGHQSRECPKRRQGRPSGN